MNDYNYTAHPRVLEALQEAEGRRFVGYGDDEECAKAADLVRGLICRPDADVHFLPGGTQTNLTALGAFLRPHEAAIAPTGAHINVHETGAIEAVGHKILAVPAHEGKALAEDVRTVCELHNNEHMAKPKLLFVSQTTELGTVYTRAELLALREVCDEYGLLLYIDGARLGCSLAAGAGAQPETGQAIGTEQEAISKTGHSLKAGVAPGLPELADIADAFYIGGTKNGLLFGEALVICNKGLTPEFRYLMKQRGGLLSKGFLLGIQFRAILEDGLYFELARRANAIAVQLSEGLRKAGIPLLTDTASNQVFPCVSDEALHRLEERVLFEVWERKGADGTPIRFVTTWRTTPEEIAAVLELVP
jgi:threonine aldolase